MTCFSCMALLTAESNTAAISRLQRVMPVSDSLAQIVGSKLPDLPVSWNKRDLITYAFGVGAKHDEYPYIYELDKKFAALPTYPSVLSLKLDGNDVNFFSERMRPKYVFPGMPTFDLDRVVHASQSIEVLRTLPLVSGEGWKFTSRYTGSIEKKNGLILTTESVLIDPEGTPYSRLYSSTFHMGATATGIKMSESIAGPPQAKAIPERMPDWVIRDQTTPEQAIIFRLSGDYNPLHIDPKIGQATGIGGVILHGRSTFGFAARAIIKSVGGGDPASLNFIGSRFTSPVKPGDGLETQIWEVGAGPNGTTEVVFVTNNLETGKVALSEGIAYITKSNNAKL